MGDDSASERAGRAAARVERASAIEIEKVGAARGARNTQRGGSRAAAAPEQDVLGELYDARALRAQKLAHGLQRGLARAAVFALEQAKLSLRAARSRRGERGTEHEQARAEHASERANERMAQRRRSGCPRLARIAAGRCRCARLEDVLKVLPPDGVVVRARQLRRHLLNVEQSLPLGARRLARAELAEERGPVGGSERRVGGKVRWRRSRDRVETGEGNFKSLSGGGEDSEEATTAEGRPGQRSAAPGRGTRPTPRGPWRSTPPINHNAQSEEPTRNKTDARQSKEPTRNARARTSAQSKQS